MNAIIPAIKAFLISVLKGKILKALVKSALLAYVQKTETPIDDTIYSIIVKISEGKTPTDEINFLVNHFIK